MKKVCLIGYPAKHSLSPAIHGYWLEKYGIDGKYEIREIEPNKFDDFFKNLHKEGYVGCNITVPFKERAFELARNIAGNLDGVANAMKAINTILIKDNEYVARNTDGTGFLHNLQKNADQNFAVGKISILGAGGAARAIIVGLLAGPVKEIFLTNRTQEKAEKIKKEVESLFPKKIINVVSWVEKEECLKEAGLLINTTSLGMVGQPPLDIDFTNLPKTALVTDIVYRPLITPLLEVAKNRGNPIVDGLGMLLYQAVPGFEMWFEEELKGRKVEVTAELRKKIESML